jgi:serine/threonine protein kinase
MIAFSCPTCQKKLTGKEGSAGKRARCPACGQTVTIPAAVALSPSCEATPPSQLAADVRTKPLASDPDTTHTSGKTNAGHDLRLTEFLAPSQAVDELGRLGKYRVLKVLGHGGMGVVFKAEDPKLKRSVAIKAMLPTLAASASAGKRFLREAQAMAAVKHDHIVTIYQVDEERGIPFLAMEFLSGEPLDERLDREGKLPLAEVLRIGREIAEGLEAAHATGLIHRDVKPANVWLEAPRDRVKILDFGLARASSRDASLTQEGMIMGTPAYMAPEQARGEAVDSRCDLFSLGCVLYRMLTGHQPFQAKDLSSTLLAVTSHQPPAPARLNAGVPLELSELVMRLLEKDAAGRPASAGGVAEALRCQEGKLAREGNDRRDALGSKPAQRGLPGARASRERGIGTDEPIEKTVPGKTPRFQGRQQPLNQTTAGRPPPRRRQARGMPWWAWALSGVAILGLGLAVAIVLRPGNAVKQQSVGDTSQATPSLPKQPVLDDTPKGWQSFSPPGGRFAVLLPGEPKAMNTVTETERGPIQNHTFTIETGANTYAVSWFDFPGFVPEGPQIKESLEGGKKGLVTKLSPLKVLKETEISIDGFPGQEVVVENAEKKYRLTARLYLVGQRTYTLLATTPLGQDNTPEVRHFLASFRLVR